MPKKILIVDDDDNLRELYGFELTQEGFIVDTAENAEEAFNKIETFKPDLITMDIKMPGMNGIECMRKIKEANRDMKVILSTAYSGYKEDFSTWVSDAYVVKSSDLTELKVSIKKLLKES